MKIWLAALDAHGGGGITNQPTNIAKGLNDVGHEVLWITPIGKLVQDISTLALALHCEVLPDYGQNSVVEILETLAVNLKMNFSLLLREEKPDILHCHDCDYIPLNKKFRCGLLCSCCTDNTWI